MPLNVADLKTLMKRAGIEPDLVDQLDPAVPVLRQGLDSIDLPLVAMAAEKEWGITILDADAVRLRTLDDFVAYVVKRRAGG